MTASLLALLARLPSLPQGAFDAPNAPSGTGLEWMIIVAFVVPAVLVAALVYVGSKNTV